jgi:glucose uptake protein GlcU
MSSVNIGTGYVCCVIAGILFGSNFIPVKKFETGNGIYFQWILCSAIWLAGFIVNAGRAFPPFQPLAMLGGALWCTGNMLTVPIIKLIGMGLGQVIWSDISLAVGWLSGAFGILGVVQQPSPIFSLSVIGTVLALISAVVFSMIRTDLVTTVSLKDADSNMEVKEDMFHTLSPLQRKLLGVLLCCIAGCFYGLNFNPPTHIMNTCSSCSQNGLDYVFSHFTGLYLTSTLYFLVYCLATRNHPKFYPQATFPGFISGLMWATAQICWFIANTSLKMVMTYPIISTLPSVVSFFWGVVIFKEFSGRRNYIFFGIAYALSFSSIACTVLSSKPWE